MALAKQKSDKYSIFNTIRKCGFPEKIEKTDEQLCLDYTSELYSVDVNTQFCFEQKRLSSVSYTTDELSKDKLEAFLSEFENDIENIMPISLCYESSGKRYWELSDGWASAHICVNCKNNKCHIHIDFFLD